MKTVLVTGAGGFIGSHLCERLVRQGWKVRALVRYTSHDQAGALVHADPDARAEVEIVTGDLRDPFSVRRAITGREVVLHLGAVIAIPYSYRNPREVVETNVIGTLNVLEAALDLGVERVVHTSTSEVYGTARTAAITEAHPLQGQSPYSASKIGADKLVESFIRSFDLPALTLRPFNTYGPRQSPRAVIPTILMQALHGSVIRLGSLTPTRDFTYVTDTARAFELAATVEQIEGEVIHLGTGHEISVGEIVEMAGRVLGRELVVEQEVARVRPDQSEVMRLFSDPSNARDRLGWVPEVDLAEGIRRTADWLDRHADWFTLGAYAV